MYVKTQAIVLQALKHQDSSLVLKLFSNQKGLITSYLKNDRAKKKRTVKWQLLDVVNLDLVHSNKNDFYGIREASYALNHIKRYQDPYKLSMSYFVAEILLKAISEKNMAYSELYEFALISLNHLDETKNISLYPIDFLLKLSDVLGIKPKVVDGADIFNLTEGTIDTAPVGLQSISTIEVKLLADFIQKGVFSTQPSKDQRTKQKTLVNTFFACEKMPRIPR